MKRQDDMPQSLRKLVWALAYLTAFAGLLLVCVLAVVSAQALWELVVG